MVPFAAGERSPGVGSPVEGGPPGSHHPIMGPGSLEGPGLSKKEPGWQCGTTLCLKDSDGGGLCLKASASGSQARSQFPSPGHGPELSVLLKQANKHIVACCRLTGRIASQNPFGTQPRSVPRPKRPKLEIGWAESGPLLRRGQTLIMRTQGAARERTGAWRPTGTVAPATFNASTPPTPSRRRGTGPGPGRRRLSRPA